MHARVKAGVGRRVVDVLDPAGRGCGALDGYAQGYPKSGSAPEDESRVAVVAGWCREGGAKGRRCVMRLGFTHPWTARRSASAFPWARGLAELVCAGVHEMEIELLRFT